MTVTAITSWQQFREIINGADPVVIDFWAEWCGPCRLIAPAFEKISNKKENQGVAFYKVNVDDHSDISQEVGIRAMPTFMVFKNGNKVDELVGASPGGIESLVARGKSL
ncbi:hypothetical protein D9615_001003 [Tricholomella constricta]|uniref:Thioredoxin n=1 Tax=Tricholomella constricta TaxID=117010 RepID=A0A8H5HK65_9AGAR|nr:hypothetical protein D9615_001003 [Tricholomella constricta]